MANHRSALKRIRQSEKKRVNNKYYGRSMRGALKEIRSKTKKEEAEEMFPKVSSMLDKLAKKNIIHKNKAANLKSKLHKKIQTLA